MKLKKLLFCELLAIGALFLCVGPSNAQISYNGPPTATTQSTPPTNTNGTKNVPLWENTNGALWVELLSLNGAASSANQTSVQSAPGTPQTVAITIQGNASGIPIPISGTISATNPSVGNTGSAVPASGTLIGGKNGSGNLTAIATDSSGNVGVNIENWLNPIGVTGTFWQTTQPVSGTVTVNAGTNLNTSALALETGGNLAGAKSDLDTIQTTGIPVTSLPSVTGTVTVNAGTNTSTAGLSTTANQTNGNQKTQIVDGIGNVIASTSNALNVDVVAGGGSSGAVAQGSTTSGQSGILTQGAVTTASPSYTTGQTSPISLTTAGAIRTDSSATTQPVSAVSLPLPSNAAQETGGNLAAIASNQTNGSEKAQLNDSVNGLTANIGPGTPVTSITGNNVVLVGPSRSSAISLSNSTIGSSNSAVYDCLNQASGAALFAAVQTTGNITIQESADQTTWINVPYISNSNLSSSNSAFNSTGVPFYFPILLRYVRLAYAGGTAGTYTGTLSFSSVSAIILGISPTSNYPVNIATIGGSISTNVSPAGSSKADLGTVLGGVFTNPDISATSIASAQYVGTIISDANGGAPSASYNISSSITTLGSCTGIQYQLQESWDSGTTWTIIWSSPMQTSTNPDLIIPPMTAPGRRRWVTATLNNTAPTTASVTVIADNLSSSARPTHTYYDYTPAVLSGVANTTSFTGCSTTSGSTTVSGSTLTYANGLWVGESVSGTNIPAGACITAIVSGTSINLSLPATASGSAITLSVAANSEPFWIENCGNIRASISAGSITTTGATYQVYEADTANGPWFPVGSTFQAVANKTITQTITNSPAEYAMIQTTTPGSGQTGSFLALCAN